MAALKLDGDWEVLERGAKKVPVVARREFGKGRVVPLGSFGPVTAGRSSAAADRDGDVDFVDYIAAKGNFGSSVGPGPPGAGGSDTVPEPSALALLGLGSVGLIARRRRP